MTRQSRLERLLVFLSVSGGAALLCKRSRRALASAGEVDGEAIRAALDVAIEPEDAVVRVEGGVVAEVGLGHRLFVVLSSEAWDAAFAHRVQRARDIMERFALDVGRAPPAAPPTPAPAHAVVFPIRPRRS